MDYKWKTDLHAFDTKKRSKINSQREQVLKHPLDISKSSEPSLQEKRGSIMELDPLTRMAFAEEDESFLPLPKAIKETFEPWAVKKSWILSKYTTQEKLSITTSTPNSNSFDSGNIEGISEKVLQRLEQLDIDTGAKEHYTGLSQQEYTSKITQLDQELTAAWEADLRVNSLKIAIQCSKLLGDTSVIYFYPTKFVIITDILDKFGSMVYNRLRGKQSEPIAAEVSRETCKNWFYKVGSIRELLPRLAIELAILKSSSFLTPNPEYGKALRRLLSTCWGIGDPVVSIYMRCYICRAGIILAPDEKELYMQCFQDILLLHDQVLDYFRNSLQLAREKVKMEIYISVLTPAIDWILQCLVHRGEHLNYTLQLISTLPPFWKSVLLTSLLNTFPPSFISRESCKILENIQSLETNLCQILSAFGSCLLISEPSPGKDIISIWEGIWTLTKRLQLQVDYLSSSTVWAEFVAKHLDIDGVNEFLETTLTRVSYKEVESYGGLLGTIADKLVAYFKDPNTLLTSEPFIKLLSMLQKETVKNALVSFCRRMKESDDFRIEDSLLVHNLMHLSTKLHDSIDALSPVDEVKQIGALISCFIDRVNFGTDYEKLLNFYGEARGAFTNIDSILITLVHCVCRLGMKIYDVVGSEHTKRTRNFLTACIAYAFITIPSIENYEDHLNLYLILAQVAYSNHCINQGEACLKAAITLLSENYEKMSESGLVEYVLNLLSTLLGVPDNPKDPHLYLLSGLMSIDFGHSKISTNLLSLLAAYAQHTYPYSFSSVDGNNVLYGGDEEFIGRINELGSTVLNTLISTINSLDSKKQFRVSVELLTQIVDWGESSSEMSGISALLYKYCARGLEPKKRNALLAHVKNKSDVFYTAISAATQSSN